MPSRIYCNVEVSSAQISIAELFQMAARIFCLVPVIIYVTTHTSGAIFIIEIVNKTSKTVIVCVCVSSSAD